MTIGIDLGDRSYDIILERGCMSRTAELLNTDRKCLIVTDDGVPERYAGLVASGCAEPYIVTLPQGESSKSMAELEHLLTVMLSEGFTRGDCVIAVGGGMCGDIAGFAAATYMRGVDFYNIPTTVLSQADSSIGGKTAVNLGGAKNIAGAFWQPQRVLIDPDTLGDLPEDQIRSGLAEIIKAGLIADRELFEYIERLSKQYCSCLDDAYAERPADGKAAVQGAAGQTGLAACIARSSDIERLLEAALRVKKDVVEEDEREGGRRRILNFGHTIGHGIESVTGMLHGWCVAAGMVPMCSPEVKARLEAVLGSLGLPASVSCSADEVYQAMLHDKKMNKGSIAAVYVDRPGAAEIRTMTPEELYDRILTITD